MVLFYNLVLTFLYPIFYFIALFTKSGKKFLTNRTESLRKLNSFQRNPNSKLYWLHAASVGELDQCKAIAKIIRERETNSQIVQSVYSSSVTEKHLDSLVFDFTFYLPLDFFWAYKKLFQTFQPNYLIIAAWDTWLNLIRTAKKYNAKTFLVCATMNPSSGRLKFPFNLFTKKIFSYFDFILPADALFQLIFENIIPKSKIGICADSRFDSVMQKIEQRSTSPTLPKSNKKIIILASTYEEDENLLLPILPELLKNFTIWLFPHKVDEKNLHQTQARLNKHKLHFKLYSQLNLEHVQDFVLFDKLGILAHAYEKGFYAYVGGAIHNRVHNVIEPAFFGLPILCGPKISHSAEARVLKELGGLFVIHSAQEFLQVHFNIVNSLQTYQEIQGKNREFVLSKRGSSEKIYLFIKSVD